MSHTASQQTTTSHAGRDLAKETLRTVLVLVASCVLFVGTLSLVAVSLTSRAFASAPAGQTEGHAPEASSPDAAKTPKKPLSI